MEHTSIIEENKILYSQSKTQTQGGGGSRSKASRSTLPKSQDFERKTYLTLNSSLKFQAPLYEFPNNPMGSLVGVTFFLYLKKINTFILLIVKEITNTSGLFLQSLTILSNRQVGAFSFSFIEDIQKLLNTVIGEKLHPFEIYRIHNSM